MEKEFTKLDNDLFIKQAAFYYASNNHGRINDALYTTMIKQLSEFIKPNSGKKLLNYKLLK